MAEEERKESDRDGGSGRVGEGGESSKGFRSLQCTTPKKETRLVPCTRAPGLWDASVEKESCRCQCTLDGTTRFRLLRNFRTCKDAVVCQAGLKIICSSREDVPGASPPTFGCRICCAGVRWRETQFILARSEVTMEVRRCQCAHHCREQMQRLAAAARRWRQTCRICGWVS